MALKAFRNPFIPSQVRSLICPLAGLFILILAAYASCFGNGFLLDDEFLLQKNRFITDWEYFWRIFTSSSTMGAGGSDSFYRPMQTLSYFTVYQIFGLHVGALHALNVGLHAANAGLIYVLAVHRFGLKPLVAFSAAALWATHPIHTEAVTYMSATADPLYTFFILLGLLSWPRLGWACLFFVLGLMSKESAIVFPAMVMVLIAIGAEQPLRWRAYLRTWPLWVLAIAYLILRKTILDFDDTFNFYSEPNIYTENIGYRVLTFLGTLPMYLELLFWPRHLHMEREFPVFAGWTLQPILGGGLVLLAGVGLCVERYKRVRPLSLMALWFFIAHSPHTGILLPVNSLFLEHWMYLPSIGLILGFMFWLQLHKVPPVPLTAISLVLSFILGSLTFMQNRVWSDPITFYENILQYTKGTIRVFNNLGMAYGEQGDSDRAIQQYLHAIEIKDGYPQVRHNLAEEFMRRGRYQEAIPHLQRALEMNPKFYYSLKNLAISYQQLGDEKKAQYYYNLYQTMRPD